MAFTDIPIYILENFFNIFNTSPVTDTSIVKPIIISEHWDSFEVSIKTSYKFENVRFISSEGFTSSERQVRITPYSGDFSKVSNGDEVYFRKGSELYKYLSRYTDYDFININKDFLFLGNIYNYQDDYVVSIDSIYYFVINAFPTHNLTDNLKEFLRLSFDKIYPDIYQPQKNVLSLMDAWETNKDYLKYNALSYDVDINENYLEENKELARDYVHNLPNLLKRKGTYSSLYIILNSLLKSTANKLTVFERWHPEFDWNANSNPIDHFVDFDYLNYYSMSTSGNCESGFVPVSTDVIQGGISTPIDDAVIHKQTSNSNVWYIHHGFGNKNLIVQVFDNNYNKISPKHIYFWKEDSIQILFDKDVSGYAFIVDSESIQTIPSTADVWQFDHDLNTFFPITHYKNINDYTIEVDKETLESKNTINVYPAYEEDGESAAITPDFIYTQPSPSASWEFEHNINSTFNIVQFFITSPKKEISIQHDLGTRDLFVQCYKLPENELMFPISNRIIDKNTIELSFISKFKGYVSIARADVTYTESTSASDWEINTTLNDQKYVLSQFYKEGYTQFIESGTIPTSAGFLHSTFSYPLTGHSIIGIPDYIEEITIPQKTWNIKHSLDNNGVISQVFTFSPKYKSDTWRVDHGLNTKNVIVQCYDEDNYWMVPANISIITNNIVEINFSTPQNGTIMISETGSSYTFPTSGDIEFSHNECKFSIQQIYERDYEVFIPEIVELKDDSVKYFFSQATSGYAFVESGDFVHDQKTLSDHWAISHGLNNTDLITQFYTKQLFTEGSTWNIKHDLGFVLTEAYNLNNYAMSPDEVTITENPDEVTIDWDGSYLSGYAVISPPNYTHTQSVTASEWTINHNLGTEDIVVQLYTPSPSAEKFIPDNLKIVDSNTVEVSAGTLLDGMGLVGLGNYTHIQSVSATEWIINHNTGKDGCIVSCYDEDNFQIIPDNIILTDENTVTLQFGSAVSGRAVLELINPPVRQIYPSDVKIMNSGLVYAWFDSNISGYAIVKQSEALSHFGKMYPKSIKVIDKNNLQIDFDQPEEGIISIKSSNFIGRYVEKTDPKTLTLSKGKITANFDGVDTTGYAMVKNVGYQGYHGSLLMSPHYRTQLDLSCNSYGENYIINQEKSDMLINSWEDIRPSCKYAHYEFSLNPYTDFSGTEYSLYSNTEAECNSYSTVTIFTSGGESYIHSQYTASNEWIIYHNLNSNIFIQCFDNNDVRIYSSEIYNINKNTTKVSFGSKIIGYALITTNDEIFTQTCLPSGSIWSFTHSLSANESLVQVYDTNDILVYPDVIVSDTSNEVDIEFSRREMGYAVLETPVLKITQTTPVKTWNINHNFGKEGIIAQFFDNNGNKVEPSEYKLIDKNNCKATFYSAVKGFALLEEIGNKYTIESIIYNINNGGYVKFGKGSDLSNYNPYGANDIKNPILDGNGNIITKTANLIEKSDYIKISGLLTENIESQITEVGIFDQFNNIIFYTYMDQIYKIDLLDFNYTLTVYKEKL